MSDLLITPDALAARIGAPDAPLVVDLRTPDDAADDPTRVPAAIRAVLSDVEAGRLPPVPEGAPKETVVYCQKGGKISQLGAALLRSRGVPACALAGGHRRWTAEGGPVCALEPPAARWLAPLDPTWDEVAAEWVLRRLVDRTAAVARIERAQIPDGARVWDAAALPADPAAMAARAGLTGVPDLSDPGGGDRLAAGRLRRGGDPLDLIDDLRAGAAR